MPELTVDFSDVEEFTLLPRGEYNVEVTDVTPQTSQAGNAMMVMRYKVTDGEYAGRGIFDNLMLEKGGRWRTKIALAVLLGREVGQETVDFTTDDLIGAQARVRLIHRIWSEEDGGDGEPRARISRYMAPSDRMEALFTTHGAATPEQGELEVPF